MVISSLVCLLGPHNNGEIKKIIQKTSMDIMENPLMTPEIFTKIGKEITNYVFGATMLLNHLTEDIDRESVCKCLWTNYIFHLSTVRRWEYFQQFIENLNHLITKEVHTIKLLDKS